MSASTAETGHTFEPEPDTKYPSLHRPRCSCGWSRPGYVKAWLARAMFDQHAGPNRWPPSLTAIPQGAGLLGYPDGRPA